MDRIKLKILKPVQIILAIVFFIFALMLIFQLDISCFIAGVCCWIACIRTAKLLFDN
jgi:hypothetical protein